MNDLELYHYGVKGMKWGVRRYENADGSLTDAGRKRISKQYKKTAIKATNELNKNYTRMQIDAYNKSTDHMNSGGIERYNNQQRKKYGDDYAKRVGYIEGYEREFNKLISQNMNKSLNEFYSTNKNIQKARDLVKKYDMTSWDDLAKHNEANIEEVRTAVEKNL